MAPSRIEIRDGKTFTVTELTRGQRLAPREEGTNPRAKGTNPRANSNRECGECGFIGKPGKRWRIRGQWVRCPACVQDYSRRMKQGRELQPGEIETINGPVALGWNGVPSAASLRRRSR